MCKKSSTPREESEIRRLSPTNLKLPSLLFSMKTNSSILSAPTQRSLTHLRNSNKKLKSQNSYSKILK